MGQAIRRLHDGRDILPTPPALPTLRDGADSAKASEWIDAFKHKDIPKGVVEFTYSRSSGPGGQNVNKVNTKATLRVPLSSPWIPMWARDHIKATPAYVSSSQSILITSTVFRSQAQNVEDCLLKLRSLVLRAAAAGLVHEASEEQKEHVRRLEKAEKTRRRADKEKRSMTKRTRSNQTWD
ncbi:RF-1 domain-containing protein [Epithele typhae]|uniref:RF-1 domain-containing protein n=1 Tax=Epithele typhae TaxID=378194 RepID=UPI0020088959|nr:RF-1 domain-containing protein [Epithele typhae]KAH9945414.1 RF-1 domain-containing protein [Epithele typhae]